MNQRPTDPLRLALALAALAIGWTIVAASAGLGSIAVAAAYLSLVLVLSIDLVDYLVRLYVVRFSSTPASRHPSHTAPRFTRAQKRLHVRPYALVVSVYNAEREISGFLQAMEPFRKRLWIVDDGSTDGTVSMLQGAGYRCVPGRVNRKKPGAIRRLLRSLPREIETVVVLDPDIRPVGWTGTSAGALESVIFDLQRSGAAAVTPLITVRATGLLALFQRFEYFMALAVGRRSLGDSAVSSGIAIYQREALERALDRHSLSVYAEDLELSLLLLGQGERIYYDGRLEVETDGQETPAGLFSQRVGWSYGLLRAYASRFREVFRVAARGPFLAYQFLGYFGIISIVIQPLRLAALIAFGVSLANGLEDLAGIDALPGLAYAPPSLFVVTYTHYLVLSLLALLTAVPRGKRLELIGIVPLYVFYAVSLVIPTTVGYLNWLLVKSIGWRLYRDHYQDESSLRDEVAGATLGGGG